MENSKNSKKLLLSCFRFPAHVSMDYILIETLGQHPIMLSVSISVTYLEILLIESPSQQSPAVLAASVYCCSRYVLGSLDISLASVTVVLTLSVHYRFCSL